MNTRSGPMSPVSTGESAAEWSPVNRYTNFSADNSYSPTFQTSSRGATPPTSVHGSSSTDGGIANAMARPNGNPSPPNSVGRSSDGTGLYAQSMNDQGLSGRKMMVLEEALGEHYRVLKVYLGPYLRDEKGNPRPSRAKDKLTRLSAVQFQELSTDVYDESIRRETDRKRGGPGAPGNETPKYLLPKQTFHPKRNQARQKLSTLPIERFRQLATDVYYELERRYPRFGPGPDVPRPASPTGSMASRGSRGMSGGMRGGRPPPGGYRGPPPPGSAGSLRPGGPIPKTFQQNTIVPNKGTMVEDDDSGADDDDAFNLEGAAARRQTNKSAKSMGDAQDKMISDLQKQASDLQAKIDSLEDTLRAKNDEMANMNSTENQRDGGDASGRAEWEELRYALEAKVDNAESLNSSLQTDIDRLRAENADTERKLRSQIEDLEAQSPQGAYNGGGGWKERCEELERELNEQQQITEEVRRDAQTFLQEMRELSTRSDAAVEREERYAAQVSSLEGELKDWKTRYARAKTQLRSLKASSIGLNSLASPDITNYARDASFATPDGVVKDVHVTQFQLSIDELLQVARRADSEHLLESMRHVVKCVRSITGDVDTTPLSALQSPNGSVNGDMANPEKQQTRLKSRVSATANNLITASKNHASSNGLSPVSLLDAAASHLSTAVIELVKLVRIRPTPEGEFEQDEEDDMPMPLKPTAYTAYSPNSPSHVNGVGSISSMPNHQRHRSSKGGSSSSTRYSNYSSPYSGYDRQSIGTNGAGEYERDAGMTEFKNYLEDQTALLVQSIQPLVNLIRSTPSPTPADEQQINAYIQDISQAVQDTANRTYDAVKELSNPALKKHATPVVEVLEDCRQSMLEVDVGGGGDRIPPLAFKTARALKELVLRVDRIESGELTFDQALKTDF
ncbi:cell polarity protein-like protein [Massarina eburnea CBS 473.64]|uniref:Cell polarity protein-like protein n=1 Tax=Massarina eburnea CBS 473.64 TaxID=1395130 RepID=A0A6A6RXX1_9PLEO|nr:cell polarity protein-like protein [Massarina eburnea CBS 473.64]